MASGVSDLAFRLARAETHWLTRASRAPPPQASSSGRRSRWTRSPACSASRSTGRTRTRPSSPRPSTLSARSARNSCTTSASTSRSSSATASSTGAGRRQRPRPSPRGTRHPLRPSLRRRRRPPPLRRRTGPRLPPQRPLLLLALLLLPQLPGQTSVQRRPAPPLRPGRRARSDARATTARRRTARRSPATRPHPRARAASELQLHSSPLPASHALDPYPLSMTTLQTSALERRRDEEACMNWSTGPAIQRQAGGRGDLVDKGPCGLGAVDGSTRSKHLARGGEVGGGEGRGGKWMHGRRGRR